MINLGKTNIKSKNFQFIKMTHLSIQLPDLKKSVIDFMLLVRSQINNGFEALKTFDKQMAMQIVSTEKRANAYELKIDADCESYIALYQPVAIDLRFVLAVYNMNSTLERIADHAEGIARYIIDFDEPLYDKTLVRLRLDKMYAHVIAMLDSIITAFDKEDTKLARKVFDDDIFVNEINRSSPPIVKELILEYPDKIEQILYLNSIIKKIERIGDLTKNMAEELIFYTEAKVLKHINKKVDID